MRVVLLADTHGFLDPRIAEAAAGADWVIHAGDVGDGIAEATAALGRQCCIVIGNNDPAETGWPREARIDLPGGMLAVMHGHQWPAKTRHRRLIEHFPDARAIVLGHSHRRVVETDTTPWILNPGAAGKSRAYGGPSFIELFAEPDGWRVETHVFSPWSKRRR